VDTPDLRASDADRERVVRSLQRHTSAGRLSLDEYADRVEQALRARTHGELATVLGDLPAEPNDTPTAGPTVTSQLAVAFLISAVALLVLTTLVLLLR
jgi:hypothetical protein